MTIWHVVVVNEDAAEELRALSADLRGKFERIVALIEAKGLEQVHEPYIKHLEASCGKSGETTLPDRST